MIVVQEDSHGCQVEESSSKFAEHITVRGIVTSFLIGILFSVIIMKLNLTTGLNPNLNVSAALLAFVFIKTWTRLLFKAGIMSTPFTPQETTIIQTCAVACYSVSIAGGFGSYLLGLNKKTYELAGVDTKGNVPGSYKELQLGWMTGFLFLSCFVGLLALVPLRKILIIDYKLPYPSGTATAVIINGFHTQQGDKMAKEQLGGFIKFMTVSFFWGFFQWFYSAGSQCGFSQFPTFGLKARKQTFYFDFSSTYIGTGMICSHLVNFSLLLGAVFSWGVMWPLISDRRGIWFPSSIPENSMKSLNGYKVFLSISLLLGDALYNFIKIVYFTAKSIHATRRLPKGGLKTNLEEQNQSLDDPRPDEVFTRGRIPVWIACAGYVLLSVISIIALPVMFHELKWYYIVVAYTIAPVLCFANAYGTGLTDMNMAYNYGKTALFILAALGGERSGVVAGLLGCGLVKTIVHISSQLMQDLKTSHLTLTSPRSMLISQAIGTAMGCILGPLSFFLFYKAFDIGNPNGEYKAPYALIYRNVAIIGVEGFSALPHHCLQLCYGFFAFAVIINLLRDLTPEKIANWVPIPIAMAYPFLVGASFTIDMCLGSVVVFLWNKINSNVASLMVPAVASGLICGDGLWILPASILALAGIKPPICMTFLSS